MHGTNPTRFVTSQKQADEVTKKNSFIIRMNQAILSQKEKGQTLIKLGTTHA